MSNCLICNAFEGAQKQMVKYLLLVSHPEYAYSVSSGLAKLFNAMDAVLTLVIRRQLSINCEFGRPNVGELERNKLSNSKLMMLQMWPQKLFH